VNVASTSEIHSAAMMELLKTEG